MRIEVCFLFCTVSLFFISCERKEGVRNILRELVGTEIVISVGEMMHVGSRDDTARESTMYNYSMVIYVDSVSCTPCIIKNLKKWRGLVETYELNQQKVKFYFLLCPTNKTKETLITRLIETESDYRNIYIDTLGVFAAQNPSLPKENLYHCFLLDQDNVVA